MNKDKLQQQIANMEAELACMKAELSKPKEFKWEYSIGCRFRVAQEEITGGITRLVEEYLHHGRYRQTQDNAQRALERNRLANRLEALSEQLDADWVADWNDIEQLKCYIIIANGQYGYNCSYKQEIIGQVYMSENTAKKIVEMLNNKEVEL